MVLLDDAVISGLNFWEIQQLRIAAYVPSVLSRFLDLLSCLIQLIPAVVI